VFLTACGRLIVFDGGLKKNLGGIVANLGYNGVLSVIFLIVLSKQAPNQIESICDINSRRNTAALLPNSNLSVR
jgi:hypothetical protein